MAEARRGYLLIALFGLVMAGLLSLVAVYLAFSLLWGLSEMVVGRDFHYWPFFLLAPVFLAAAVLPLRAVWLYWSVMQADADKLALRRAGWRLLKWFGGIFGAMTVLLAAIASPGEELASLLGVVLVAASLVAGPLVILLYGSSPIGRGE